MNDDAQISPHAAALPAWLLRFVWLAQPLAFVPLLDAASATLPGTGRWIVAVVAWSAWAAVLLASFVPSSVSLTVGRLSVPTLPIIVAISAFGAPVAGWKVAVALAAAIVAALTWFSGETGVLLVQGSAYGAEQRFPLKPPVPYLAPMLLSWMVLATLALTGTVFLANEHWVVGAALTALAGLTGWLLGPRFHQLSRRWLVVVPAGLVVHDPLLLVENALFRVMDLSAVHLAPADTQAADLTGGTAGVVLEIVLRETDTVIKVAGRDKPGGTALHVLSLLVSPSRPGRALRAAAARHLPVG